MLSSLNNRSHQVVTGCTLMFHRMDNDVSASASSALSDSDPLIISFHVTTDVTFANLSNESLQLYIASGEPFDKAGGYGYQSLAASCVSSIHGCYYNVVGFPLHALATHLAPHLDRILQTAESNLQKQ
jgi:septum formation protein